MRLNKFTTRPLRRVFYYLRSTLPPDSGQRVFFGEIMTGYINWMQLNAPIRGDAMQMEGNPVSDHSVVASAGTATAPEGAVYASVWCTVAATIKATNLKDAKAQNKTYAAPAGTVIQVPNLTPGQSVITITDI